MVYLFNSSLSKNKSLIFALFTVFGLGKTTSKLVCKKAGFSRNLKTKDLSKSQLIKLTNTIRTLNLIIGLDLKRLRKLNIKNLLSIKSYRGLRKKQGLPIRGQRTHSNAKTSGRKIF